MKAPAQGDSAREWSEAAWEAWLFPAPTSVFSVTSLRFFPSSSRGPTSTACPGLGACTRLSEPVALKPELLLGIPREPLKKNGTDSRARPRACAGPGDLHSSQHP